MLQILKTLLAATVDYAGLFPPAQLNMADAIATCDCAQASPHAWLLGRFVLPATRLSEFTSLLPPLVTLESSRPWSLSVILSNNWADELEQIRHLAAVHPAIVVTALEVPPLSPEDIQQICLQLPEPITTFVEIPFSEAIAAYLPVLQQCGVAAKLRTGGVTRDAFPDSAQLVERLFALADAHIPFKATAGLHHPLRGNHRLTQAPSSDRATMHGFLNVALVAAAAYHRKLTRDRAIALLEAATLDSFQLTETTITWRELTLSLVEVEQARQQFFHSFGSCSIQEPITDLQTLRLL